MIGGQNQIVQIDETYFGLTQGNKGSENKRTICVFGGVDENGRGFAEIVPEKSQKCIYPVITRKIHPESVIYHDAAKIYDALGTKLGFKHEKVNHSIGFKRWVIFL